MAGEWRPSQRLMYRVGNLQASPSWLEVPIEGKEAFLERLGDAAEFGDLSEADQQMIRAGELEVAAGRSPVFEDPSTWGDWAAIDAALDADDFEALDRALELVGPGDGAGMAPVVEPADDGVDEAELALYDDDSPVEGKALGADDDGWVG
jgi:hypothetical protein